MKTIFKLLTSTAATLIVGSQAVFAQFILSPVSVTETGMGTFASGTSLTNIINHSGLDAHPFTSGVTSFDTYFTPNDKFSQNVDGTKWQSDLSFDVSVVGNIDFDLGESYKLDRIAVWNVSVQTVVVYVAETLAGLDTASPVGTFTLTQNTGSLSIRADLVDLGGVFQGRYVRFAIQSEYKFSPSNTWYYATISEVAFSAQPTSNVGTPTISATRESNGDVTLTFSGTLQSKANIQDSFQNVSGNPQSTYTIPKANLTGRQFFRSSN